MVTALTQHQIEIERNLRAWQRKPLLREIYAGFYDRVVHLVDRSIPGAIVEIGSGIGNLKARIPDALATDLFPNPWLDVICDGYEMPFADGAISHLILFDVFHHLRAPRAFLREASRILTKRGRVILFEPFVSVSSYPVYRWLHHESLHQGDTISMADVLPRPRDYYTSQGNATRLFFNARSEDQFQGWRVFHRESFASFAYMLSGGFSQPAAYPFGMLSACQRVDRWLSRWPRLFGARCLVGLERD